MLGNGRVEAFCFDGVNRLCHIRGKLRKRVWIGVGDIVLLGLRDFQDQKVHAESLAGPSYPWLTFAKRVCRPTSSSSTMAMKPAASKPMASCPTRCKSMQALRCSRAKSLATTVRAAPLAARVHSPRALEPSNADGCRALSQTLTSTRMHRELTWTIW
jgi:hypothetical protein